MKTVRKFIINVIKHAQYNNVIVKDCTIVHQRILQYNVWMLVEGSEFIFIYFLSLYFPLDPPNTHTIYINIFLIIKRYLYRYIIFTIRNNIKRRKKLYVCMFVSLILLFKYKYIFFFPNKHNSIMTINLCVYVSGNININIYIHFICE